MNGGKRSISGSCYLRVGDGKARSWGLHPEELGPGAWLKQEAG